MIDKFSQKYAATPFDPSDPGEALAERMRGALISAVLDATRPEDDTIPTALAYTQAGLMVGLAQVLRASANGSRDEVDAAIRASTIQSAGWAVDMARACQGVDPLPEA